MAHYEQSIPVPGGWDDRPCGYLLFGSSKLIAMAQRLESKDAA